MRFSLVFCLVLLCAFCGGQTYIIQWQTIDAGGNEGGSISSASYKLSSAIGQSTPIVESGWISSASYLVHPGYRKIDLDWRPPRVWFVNWEDTVTADSVLIQWAGLDSTVEEGFGWGMWVYDLQWRRDDDPPGTWQDWLANTPLTSETFGPVSPTTLQGGHWYCIRLVGHDLATNFAPWDTTAPWLDTACFFTVFDQYTLTVQTSFPGGTVYVDSSPHLSPYQELVYPGTVRTIDADSIIIQGDTTRYTFQQWNTGVTVTCDTVTVVSNTTFTAQYLKEYHFWVVNPGGYDTPVPPAGDYWYVAGDTIEAYMTTSPIDLPGDSTVWCMGFILTPPPDTTSGTYAYFYLTHACSLIWQWQKYPDDWPVCTLFVWSQYGHPMPRDTAVFPWGAVIHATVEDSVFEDGAWHHCTGYWGNGSVPTDIWGGNYVTFTIYENSHLVWVWDGILRFPFIVENEGVSVGNPDGYDTPVPPPGIYWWVADTYVTAYITDHVADGMQCVGYWAWGAIFPPADTANSVSFLLDQPTGIHWRWFDADTQIVYLDVWSLYGSPSPPIGTSGYPVATHINATVEDSVYAGGAWHICTGYWGSGSVPTNLHGGNNVSFDLLVNSQLVWVWDDTLRFPFIVQNEGVSPANPDGYDTPVPTVGIHWYYADSLVSARIDQYADGMRCIGYWSWGSIFPAADTVCQVAFYIDEPTRIQWRWADVHATLVLLSVWSMYDNPVPPNGFSYYPINTIVNARVDSTAYEGGVWHYCTGYWGSGSVPTSIPGDNEVLFTITLNSQLVWVWDNIPMFPFVVQNDGVTPWNPDGYDTPVPTVGIHWYPANDTVSGSIVPVDDTMRCTGYEGWGNLTSALAYSFSFVINQPSGVQWQWVPASQVKRLVVLKDPLETWGTITVAGAVYSGSAAETVYVLTGTNVSVAVSDTDYNYTSWSRYIFYNWADCLPCPSSRNVIVSMDTTLIARYRLQHRIWVQKNPSADTCGRLWIDGSPVTGNASASSYFWWFADSSHTLAVSRDDSCGGTKYIFLNWDNGSTDTSRGTYIVTAPDTLVATYRTYYRVTIVKSVAPPYSTEQDTFGYIVIRSPGGLGSDSIHYVYTFSRWIRSSTACTVRVSRIDLIPGTDSMYVFDRWQEGGSTNPQIVFTVGAPTTYTAIYNKSMYFFKILLYQYTYNFGDTLAYADSVWWGLDTVPAYGEPDWQPINMVDTNYVLVVNRSNVYVQLSLRVDPAKRISTGAVVWTPSVSTPPGVNKFQIRARFQPDSLPPSTYRPYPYDVVKESWTAATNGSNGIFGPEGGSVPDRSAVDNRTHLYMQFRSPNVGSFYGDPLYIIVQMRPAVALP